MRNWGLPLILLSCACSNSTTSKDSSALDSLTTSWDSSITLDAGLDSKGAVDQDICDYQLGQLATETDMCKSIQGMGLGYDLSLGVDAGSCEGRPTVPCNGACGATPTLYSQMLDLILGCGFLPAESSFGVTFSQGCAQHVSVSLPGLNEDAVVACILTALSASHFACADQIPCWGVAYSTLALYAP